MPLLQGQLRLFALNMVYVIPLLISVRTFEELTFLKPMPEGLYSVKMRLSYNILMGHLNKMQNWQHSYFYIKADEHAFEEAQKDDFKVLWNHRIGSLQK